MDGGQILLAAARPVLVGDVDGGDRDVAVKGRRQGGGGEFASGLGVEEGEPPVVELLDRGDVEIVEDGRKEFFEPIAFVN